jgi:hypothetical protein
MRDLHMIDFDTGEPAGSELKAVCEHIMREFLDGVGHGFFEMTITVETGQAKKKSITIKSGKSHRFIVCS